jgi:hypothetical protein
MDLVVLSESARPHRLTANQLIGYVRPARFHRNGEEEALDLGILDPPQKPP